MAIPRFAGYGYGASANYSRHAQSLGQFAGMELPSLGAFGGSSGTHPTHGSSFSGFAPGRAASYASAGSVIGGTKQGHHVASGTQQPGQQAHLRKWGGSAGSMAPVERGINQARRRFQQFQASRGGTGEPETTALQPPDAQLALGAGAPQQYQGFGTNFPGRPHAETGPLRPLGPSTTPALGGAVRPAGALGPATARQHGAAPSARAHGPIIEAQAQEMLPGVGKDVIPSVGAPVPSTRSVRGRRSSFNPNQGGLTF